MTKASPFQALIIILAISLAACAPAPQTSAPKVALASKEDLWRMSGTKDAIVELNQSLSDACHVSIETPDDLLKLPQTDAICVRSQLVSAFEASDGSDYCARNRNLKQFVSCILEGQFIGRVIDNSGSPALPPEIQWGDADEGGRRANQFLTEKIKATCLSPSEIARKECAEAEMLRYFDIKPEAIGFCPAQQQRDACIYWASFARAIRIKLDRIHA